MKAIAISPSDHKKARMRSTKKSETFNNRRHVFNQQLNRYLYLAARRTTHSCSFQQPSGMDPELGRQAPTQEKY